MNNYENFNIIESKKDNILLFLFNDNTDIDNAYIKNNELYINNKKINLDKDILKKIKEFENIYLQKNNVNECFILKFKNKFLNGLFNKTKIKNK